MSSHSNINYIIIKFIEIHIIEILIILFYPTIKYSNTQIKKILLKNICIRRIAWWRLCCTTSARFMFPKIQIFSKKYLLGNEIFQRKSFIEKPLHQEKQSKPCGAIFSRLLYFSKKFQIFKKKFLLGFDIFSSKYFVENLLYQRNCSTVALPLRGSCSSYTNVKF